MIVYADVRVLSIIMTRQRKSNIEILRLISMFLIIVYHYIFYGLKPLSNPISFDVQAGWGGYISMEALWVLSGVAVNCYVMITGYFLINKKEIRWDGVCRTWIQTLFYSLFFLFISMFLGMPIDNEDIMKSLFPVCSREYWFVTSYIGLLLFAPFLSILVCSLSKRQFLFLVSLLLIISFQYPFGRIYAGFRSIVWFSFLFLVGGYLKLYDVHPKLKKYNGLLFLGFWVFLVFMGTAYNYYKGVFSLVSSSFDGPIFFLSFLFFLLFLQMKCEQRFYLQINKLAPFTFGIYLIHENFFVRPLLWNMLIPNKYECPILIHCLVTCLLIFISCLIVDYFRMKLFILGRIDKYISNFCSKLPNL